MNILHRSLLFLFCFSFSAVAQQTRPERTSYEETSRYQDVIDFIRAVTMDTTVMKLSWLGYSSEGKRLPMIVYGDVPDARPESVRKSGKLVVYIQGNIHGGEVEGKEALLELLRELSIGKHAEWRRRLVLLIVPILNADGNDKISLYNRSYQHGPLAGMGERANGQGLDLNRDHMKLKSPEILSFVSMLNAYDPHMTVDLHTTNGSFHGYHITYSFALNPMIDPGLDAYTRNEFFPKVEQKVRSQKWRIHRYGDYLQKTPAGIPGYYFWAHEPRYNSNYVGFRNRLAVLVESYSYITFQQRIASTKAVVTALLDVANGNSIAIKKAAADADAAARALYTMDSLSVGAEVIVSDSAQTILLAAVKKVNNPYSNEPMYLMNEDSLNPIVTAEFYGTRPVKKAAAPLRYLIPDSLENVISLLRQHGIVVDTLKSAGVMKVQQFLISSNKQSEREYQRHKTRKIEGRYETVRKSFPAGTRFVALNQPLSRLAAALLEPESDDGVVLWNVVDPYFGDGKIYPVYKEMK